MKNLAIALALVGGCSGDAAFQQSASSFSGKDDGSCTMTRSGVLSTDETWSDCAVRLDDELTVAAGATLTIGPGVVVTATGRWTGITVLGQLQALGSHESPIQFVSGRHGALNGPDRSFRFDEPWDGLTLTGPGPHRLSHVVVSAGEYGVRVGAGATADISDVDLEGFALEEDDQGSVYDAFDEEWAAPTARSSLVGLDVESATVSVQRSLIRGFATGLLASQSPSLVISDSIVRENGIGVRVWDPVPNESCDPGAPPPPPPQTLKYFDPKLNRSDVAYNDRGVVIDGDELWQLEGCNLVGNSSEGLVVDVNQPHPAAHVQQSNLYGNSPSLPTPVQVSSWHSGAAPLDLRANFWGATAPTLTGDSDSTLAYADVVTMCGSFPVSIDGYQLDRLGAGPALTGGSDWLRPWALQATPDHFANPIPSRLGTDVQGSNIVVPLGGTRSGARVNLDFSFGKAPSRVVIGLSHAGRRWTLYDGPPSQSRPAQSFAIDDQLSLEGSWQLSITATASPWDDHGDSLAGVLRSWSLDFDAAP